MRLNLENSKRLLGMFVNFRYDGLNVIIFV